MRSSAATLPLRRPQRVSAAFCSLSPGDVLTHPRTGEPIGRVVSFSHAASEREGKPRRYRITITADDLAGAG